MKSIVVLCLSAAAVAAVVLGATARGEGNAQKLRAFHAELIAGQEVAKPSSTGFGLAFFTLHESTRTVDYAVTVNGLSGAPNAMHLHGPALPGVNASPVVTLTTPSGATSQVTGTTAPLTPQQMNALKKGLFYINVHTAGSPDGEIRGQVLLAPTTYREPSPDDNNNQ